MTEVVGCSVVIVTWQSESEIAGCIRSLWSGSAIPSEIVVVDNHSNDATVVVAEALRAECPPEASLEVLVLEENSGFPKANNVGVSLTTEPLLFFLNPDTVADSAALEALFASYRRTRQEVSGPLLVGPTLLGADDIMQWPCHRRFPTIASLAFLMAGLKLRYFKPVPRPPGEYATRVDALCGAAILVSRLDFRQIGGWDEGMFMYLEDLMLCWTASQLGGAAFHVWDARVLHYGGVSSARADDQVRMALLLVASYEEYFRRTRGPAAAVAYRLAILPGVAMRLGYAVVSAALGHERAESRKRSAKSYTQMMRWLLGHRGGHDLGAPGEP